MENQKDMDLEIAKLLKEENKFEIKHDKAMSSNSVSEVKEKETSNEIDEIEIPTQDEVDEWVKKGYFEWDNKKFKFERQEFFDNKISFMFPIEILKLDSKDNSVIVYVNFEEGINCILSSTLEKRKIDIIKIKESILLNFKMSKVKADCIEEGITKINSKKISYCTVVNDLPNDNIFNLMFFVEVESGFITVNFNGFTKKYYKLWTLIYKAILKTVEI